MLDDLQRQDMTPVDAHLFAVYGDTIYRNDGCHLHGGFDPEVDRKHMEWFDRVVVHPHRLYSPPPVPGRQETSVNIGTAL